MSTEERPFWERLTLEEMSDEQWESLCDGCAQCCLFKLEDEDTNELRVTDVVCRYLDQDSCQCGDYPNRHINVPDCIPFRDGNIREHLYWMPYTCAYRVLAEDRKLPEWHPLITGDPESVVAAGQSVKGRCIVEDDDIDLESRFVDYFKV